MGLLDRILFRKSVPAEVLTEQSTTVGMQGNPDWPQVSIESFVKSGYGGHELIYACIKKIAESASQARMIHQTQVEQGDETEEIHDGEVAYMLKSPNDFDTQLEFLSYIHTSLQVSGNAYIFKERAGRRVVNYWTIPPHEVGIVPGPRGPRGYTIRDSNSVDRFIQPEDIGHLKFTSLGDKWFGLAPLQLSAKIANLDISATDYAKVFYQNSGVPRGILKVKSRLDKARAAEIRAEWRQRFSGRNAHDIGVLDEFAEYQKVGSDLGDIELPELRDLLETRICAVHGVPPILVGSNAGLKRGTYSNYENARESFWHETLLPLYKRIGDFMTRMMREDFDMGESEIGFDFSRVAALQENVTEKVLEVKEKALTAGIYIRAGFTPESVVAALDLPEDLVHTGLVAVNLQAQGPSGAEAESDVVDEASEGEEDTPGEDTKAIKALNSREMRMFEDVTTQEYEDAVEDLELVFEKAFAKQVRTANGVMGQYIQQERENGTKATIPFNSSSLIPPEADDELITAARPFLLDVAARTWIALDGPAVLEAIAWDAEAPAIQQVLRNASERVRGINDVTRKAINEQLKLGTERGYSLDRIAKGVPDEGFKGVRSVIEETYKNRAKTIARTEVRSAQNMTTAARYRASGIEYVEIRDGDVDEQCAAVNGTRQTVAWYAENPHAHPNCTRGAIPVLETAGVLTGAA